MPDARISAHVRRFMTRENVMTAAKAIGDAVLSRAIEPVEIVTATFDGQGTTGIVTIKPEDQLDWLDALEARLQEYDADPTGVSNFTGQSAPTFDYSKRRLET